MAANSLAIPVSSHPSSGIGLGLSRSLPTGEILRPEPNPPFAFPGRHTESVESQKFTGDPSQRHFSSHDLMASGSENEATIAITPPEPLPEWRFPSSALKTPNDRPRSPVRPASLDMPSRHMGHRRGGSEFIGGDGRKGGTGLMSSSPTKVESSLPVPGTSISARRAAGRGHAHRRSAAISCHDLSMVLKPVEPETLRQGNSAPTTPSIETNNEAASTPITPPTLQHKRKSLDSSSSRPSPPAELPQLRARVGFSDRLEYIPRPLSSSDSSTTATTIRGHSVTGSISSMMSQTPSPPKEVRSVSGVDSGEAESPRPKTAGAILGTPSSKRSITFADESSPFKRPVSASSSPKNSPFKGEWSLRKSLFSNTRRNDDSSPTPTPTIEKAESDCLMTPPDTPEANATTASGPSSHEDNGGQSKYSTGRKQLKKKSKSWSILSRKTKRQVQKTRAHRRTPTPPIRCRTSPSDVSAPDFNIEDFDETPPDASVSPDFVPHFPDLVPDWTSWEPRESLHLESPTNPIIDLDAALGPFNTPQSPDSRSSPRGSFSSAMQLMHSSGKTGSFIGPGMHYHRRTESAPEMQPFDRSNIRRLPSRSTMDDVFEEEEEEEQSSRPPPSPVKSEIEDEVMGMGIAVVEEELEVASPKLSGTLGELGEHGGEHRGIKRKGSGLSDEEPRPNLQSLQRMTRPITVVDEVIPEEMSPEKTQDFQSSFATKPSDDSITTTSPPKLSREENRPASPYLDLPSPNPPFMTSGISSTATSPLSSPEFPPSTFDTSTHRTAASSFTDEQQSSPLFAPTIPDMRISVDDVPSLTSSNSTMTTHQPHGCRTPGQRSSSISSAITARSSYRFSTGKRGSIVSLSRLVGSSHGEKSKLSIEAKASPDSPEKPKEKKHKRLSRMMQFWKAKDTET